MKCTRLPVDLGRTLLVLVTASFSACTTANRMSAFRHTETQLEEARVQLTWVKQGLGPQLVTRHQRTILIESRLLAWRAGHLYDGPDPVLPGR